MVALYKLSTITDIPSTLLRFLTNEHKDILSREKHSRFTSPFNPRLTVRLHPRFAYRNQRRLFLHRAPHALAKVLV